MPGTAHPGACLIGGFSESFQKAFEKIRTDASARQSRRCCIRLWDFTVTISKRLSQNLVRENLDRASPKGRSGATCTATRRWNYGLHLMDAPHTEP